jgi:hypothetical protein
MITNKYESPPNYQPLKQQRLRQIQEDYFPPPQKINCLFYSPPPHYTPTALYQPNYDDTFDPQTVFQVKKSTEVFIALIPILIFGCFFTVVPNYNGSLDDGAYLIMAGGLVGILYSVAQICDRKAYLIIHQNGLYFYKSSLYIPWEHVIATHFYKDDSSESNIYKLVTDYVDAITDTCQTERFLLTDYDKSLGEIALAITWYQQQFMKSQKITNLLIQTV